MGLFNKGKKDIRRPKSEGIQPSIPREEESELQSLNLPDTSFDETIDNQKDTTGNSIGSDGLDDSLSPEKKEIRARIRLKREPKLPPEEKTNLSQSRPRLVAGAFPRSPEVDSARAERKARKGGKAEPEKRERKPPVKVRKKGEPLPPQPEEIIRQNYISPEEITSFWPTDQNPEAESFSFEDRPEPVMPSLSGKSISPVNPPPESKPPDSQKGLFGLFRLEDEIEIPPDEISHEDSPEIPEAALETVLGNISLPGMPELTVENPEEEEGLHLAQISGEEEPVSAEILIPQAEEEATKGALDRNLPVNVAIPSIYARVPFRQKSRILMPPAFELFPVILTPAEDERDVELLQEVSEEAVADAELLKEVSEKGIHEDSEIAVLLSPEELAGILLEESLDSEEKEMEKMAEEFKVDRSKKNRKPPAKMLVRPPKGEKKGAEDSVGEKDGKESQYFFKGQLEDDPFADTGKYGMFSLNPGKGPEEQIISLPEMPELTLPEKEEPLPVAVDPNAPPDELPSIDHLIEKWGLEPEDLKGIEVETPDPPKGKPRAKNRQMAEEPSGEDGEEAENSGSPAQRQKSGREKETTSQRAKRSVSTDTSREDKLMEKLEEVTRSNSRFMQRMIVVILIFMLLLLATFLYVERNRFFGENGTKKPENSWVAGSSQNCLGQLHDIPLPYDLKSLDCISGLVGEREGISDILVGRKVDWLTVVELTDLAKIRNIPPLELGARYTFFFPGNAPGNPWTLAYEPDSARIVFFNLKGSPDVLTYNRKVLDRRQRGHSMVIAGDLAETMYNMESGLRLTQLMEDILQWRVDFFHLDPGDKFKVMFEEVLLEGNRKQLGSVSALYFRARGEDHYAFAFEKNGLTKYFDESGRSVRGEFLKAPVKFGYISSRYNLQRQDPLSRRPKIMPHMGTDYAAPLGTPIHALADGVVEMAEYSPGNGNFVKLRHNELIQTQYLHMQGFARGMRPGREVRQGEILGYVGSTGRSTGPHVCLRFWKNEEQVDHLELKFAPPDSLSGPDLTQFLLTADSLKSVLDVME